MEFRYSSPIAFQTITMALGITLRSPNKSSPNRMRQRRTRALTLPRPIILTVVIVAASQILASSALLSERSIKHPSTFTSKRLESPLFDDSASNGNSFIYANVRANSALYASTKSSNRKKQKKKQHDSFQRKSKARSSPTEGGKAPGRAISEDELSTHLNSKLNYGKRGPVSPQARTRGIMETDTDDDDVEYISDRQREQQFFLRQLNNRPTLVLNANYLPLGYMPLSLWSWQDAVKAIFKGSVTVVDVYPDVFVKTSNMKVPLPSVIALNDYVHHKETKPSFTRRNVFLRDEYICQYCNNRFHTADLSLDHVVPRSQGGPLSWENIVTCCKTCNGKKGSTPLSEIGSKGMKLNRQPRCPTQRELAAISGRMVPKRVHPTWKPYLGIQQRPPKSNNSKEKKGDEEFIDDRYFEEEA